MPHPAFPQTHRRRHLPPPTLKTFTALGAGEAHSRALHSRQGAQHPAQPTPYVHLPPRWGQVGDRRSKVIRPLPLHSSNDSSGSQAKGRLDRNKTMSHTPNKTHVQHTHIHTRIYTNTPTSPTSALKSFGCWGPACWQFPAPHREDDAFCEAGALVSHTKRQCLCRQCWAGAPHSSLR